MFRRIDAHRRKMKMPIRMIRRMILLALFLIIFSHVTLWVAAWLSHSVGTVWGLVTAGLALFCRMRATRSVKTNKRYYIWLMIPTILTLIPLCYHVLRSLRETTTFGGRFWDIVPVFISFVLPAGLLWMAHAALYPYERGKGEDSGQVSDDQTNNENAECC